MPRLMREPILQKAFSASRCEVFDDLGVGIQNADPWRLQILRQEGECRDKESRYKESRYKATLGGVS